MWWMWMLRMIVVMGGLRTSIGQGGRTISKVTYLHMYKQS